MGNFCNVFHKTFTILIFEGFMYVLNFAEVFGMEIKLLEADIEFTLQEFAAGQFWSITYFGGRDIVRRNMEKQI